MSSEMCESSTANITSVTADMSWRCYAVDRVFLGVFFLSVVKRSSGL